MPNGVLRSLLLVSLTAQSAAAEDILVFAAASLRTALDPIAAEFEAATGHDVTLSYAGSNALAAQILQGAPADIFLSAAVNWMDAVDAAGLVTPDTRVDLLGNTLVLIAHGTNASPVEIAPTMNLAGLLGDGRLSLALVDAVPAGQYARAALESLGQWDAVRESAAQSENARTALALVASGEAPLGIVYATDAAAADNVTVVGAFPPDSHPPIIYPAALLTGAADAADRAFFDALRSDAAAARFAHEGFIILD